DVGPEDFLAYVFALLAAPAYVEKFSEELALSSPRVPITKDPALFRRAVEQGRELIRLHTFGERFTPAGTRRGTVPQGSARCTRGIPTAENAYPEEFSYDPATQTLRVGEGEFAPVPQEVWQFGVSGLQVLQSWLAYRMKAGAGRQSSTLDRIRPAQWTAAMTQELLEQLLDDVLQSSVFRADELPQPTDAERKPPTDAEEEGTQQSLEM
ncbi:MAG: DNA methyltransferase, partial [Acidobacteria bacterium]|nr:DNA methyltransferase [Acidobacteriota bacterium]